MGGTGRLGNCQLTSTCSSTTFQHLVISRMDTASLAQSVTTGRHRKCREEEEEALKRGRDGSKEEPSHSSVLLDQGKKQKEEDSRTGGTSSLDLPSFVEDAEYYTVEELSMVAATSCVCALVVGFVSGFLLARRCSCSREEENPYHVPYLNQ